MCKFWNRCKQRIRDQIIEVEVIVGNKMVALCALVVYAYETLFWREIVGNVRGFLDE